ncbi:MAG: IgGFc-binding protein [Deltaproteobacteria bacterium]|nr:IgGFc-binding protein [Deltaproteobacteria bacterium]
MSIRVIFVCAVAAWSVACSANEQGLGVGSGGGGTGGTIEIDGGGGNGGMIDTDGSAGGSWVGDPKTCSHAASAHTYVGCDFWPTVLPNIVGEHFDFAVVVANAGEIAAHVKIERGGQVISEGDVPAESAGKFFLPWVNETKHYSGMCDTDPSPGFKESSRTPDGAYHLTTSVPVTVFQFNPLEYDPKGGPEGKDWSSCKCMFGCHSYTNDASLLLPSTSLTGNYFVTGYSGIESPDQNMPGYFSVIGLESDTNVTMKLGQNATMVAGGGLPAGGPGDVVEFVIGRGEVVEILGTQSTDLSGTQVHADKPVQVMSGHPCIQLPFDRQACDHLEETVLPAETLGMHYVVARPTGPGGSAVEQIVRLFGNADGTQLTYPGNAPPGAPSVLNAGDVVDLGVLDLDFEVLGDKPFAVTTFQVGNTIVDPTLKGRGDPSQSNVATVEQHRTKYVFLAPDDYDVSFADVVMPMDAQVRLDGEPLAASPEAISGGFGVARAKLGPGVDGAHLLTSDKPVGLQVMGYGFATSYQYPGGLDLKGIAPAPPPIK